MVMAAMEWARFGHALIRRAEQILAEPTATAVFSVLGTHWYVQWHGEDDRAFYLEAASGLCADRPLSKSQERALTALGRDAPGEGWGKDDVLNWSRLFCAPVSLYDVVRLTVATLRDVYLALPHSISVS